MQPCRQHLSLGCVLHWCPEQANLTFLLQKAIQKLLGDSQRCWLFSLSAFFNILSRKSWCLGCLWQRCALADSISVGHAPSCRAGSARAEGNCPLPMGLAVLGEWLDLGTLEVFINLSDLMVLWFLCFPYNKRWQICNLAAVSTGTAKISNSVSRFSSTMLHIG